MMNCLIGFCQPDDTTPLPAAFLCPGPRCAFRTEYFIASEERSDLYETFSATASWNKGKFWRTWPHRRKECSDKKRSGPELLGLLIGRLECRVNTVNIVKLAHCTTANSTV